MEQKNTRGGYRQGSGRKAPNGKRVPLSCRIAPATRARLAQAAEERGISLGNLIDTLADTL